MEINWQTRSQGTLPWLAFQFLVGEWEGENTGDPGQGYGSFTFELELDQNILVRKSSTTYPATPERLAITHEDLMIVYLEITGLLRAIYFDNEGHVIHYEVSISPDQKGISLTSDPAPMAPQFRFTYTRIGKDSLSARFEIAPPDHPGEFAVYVEGPSRRIA